VISSRFFYRLFKNIQQAVEKAAVQDDKAW